uniref:Protein tyrosine phosphatase receptor type Q n=1 Tax=Astyanax mexicanus TaxID=7994 RepID=W5K8B6_ASTMX
VSSVTPGTSYTVTVSSVASSGLSSPVSRIITTPPAPSKPEGERVGSNGILLSWRMPSPPDPTIHSFIIRYKEVCPHPDPTFTEITKSLDIPETLLNTLSPGATYNIKVAAVNRAGTGPFSQSLYFKTAEAPGLVTNLTAYAQNDSFVMVTWFLPVRINGLITKFAVKAKHARTGQTVQTLELNAEDIMNGALPHCNDAADFLSRGTPSPSESSLMTSAALPSVTLSAIPPASTWSVPISVGMDKLRPYTAYVFEVSAFTSDGEGQIASTMVRMPEAPQDSPQNLSVWNITSKSLFLSWEPPTIITGRFTYVVQLYGPALISENSTSEQMFMYTGLTPYTRYRMVVMAKSAGSTGPAAENSISTPSEPGAVSDLRAAAVDSTSVRLSWGIPSQPNGLITRYRILVLFHDILVQDITLRRLQQLPAAEEIMDLSSDHISYMVKRLSPFTEYNFSVSAYTTVGEGPSTLITEKTTEQPSSVQDVSYQNISSTSVLVSWSPPLNPNGKITHYTVYLLNLHSHEAQQQMTNATLDKYTRYKLRVAASTAVGESPLSVEDDVYILTPEDPDSPPRDLAVVNTTSSTATITWSPPDKPNGIIRLYEIFYSNATYSHTVNSTVSSVTLRNLKPYSHYNVSVQAYTLLGNGDQTSPTLQMMSGEDPGSPPYGLAYESISSSEVNVTWSPPVVPNGVILYYNVEYWNSTHTLNLTTHTPFTVLSNLRKYANYRLAVQAATQVGLGNHSSEILNITTLEDPSSPPQFLRAKKLSDNQVELSWQPPREANSEILYYIVRVNLSSEFVANVTVTSVVVSVDGPGWYNASVTSWTRLGDGGLLIYIIFSTSESPSDPPKDVSYLNLTSKTVRISWSPPTEPNGIIQFYTIYYSDNITLSTQQVPGTVQWAVLTGLRAGQEYWVWLSSSTSLGDGGVTSTPLIFSTLEDPSGPVHNLSAQLYGSTAVVISWDPPLEPNGRVFYQLSLLEAGITHPSINRTENRTITKTTTDTVFLFTKLRKYFPYVLYVTPATSAGSALNHTSVLHLRTDDDPSSPPVHSMSRNLSATSVLVSWYSPVETNGEIIEYALVLNGPKGSNSSYTPDTYFILMYLTPYTSYNLSISAVNRRGMGPSLMLALHTDEAPMSPPQNLSIFNHSSDSVWLHWEPSLEPNGLIQHYGFRIVELNTNTVTYQNSSDASTQAELSGFKPHSSYEISVCTYTRVGNGDQYSLPVTFTTNESSEAVGNLSCSGLDWDSVYMEWEPPVNPNGEILLYLIRSGEFNEEVYPLTLPDTEILTHTFSGLKPDSFYVISVAAVNSEGPGEEANCTAHTPPESPGPPQNLSVFNTSSNAVTLSWLRPARVPGLLRGYRVERQRLSQACEAGEDLSCVESEIVMSVKGTGDQEMVTLQSLLKFRRYRIRVVALTNAGAGEPTEWIYVQTLAGPDAPPRSISITPTSSGLKIEWDEPEIISGPTSYLIDVVALDGSGRNISKVREWIEMRAVLIGNLTAFTQYSVTVTAFTGDVADAHRDGMSSEPVLVRTLEEPKDPPKNLTLTVIPEEVTRVYVTFLPPDEPNGNISAYRVSIYRDGQLDFHLNINSQSVISNPNKTMTAVIDGLKGGFNYSIRISAVNGAGLGPSSEVRVTTGMKPPTPNKKPMVALNIAGAIMATSKTITIEMPECFFSDDNGPIRKIQVIISEPAMDYNNVSNWKSVFLHPPAPYFTDEGFPNPECREGLNRGETQSGTYIIGADDCFSEEAQTLCNGPLKPRTYYFKFRATNILGQYTDSAYSDRVRTADDQLLTRDEQIILGVLLSFFLALFLILIIYASVIHQRKMEGGTYSPREAEIIETKLKLDQLIAVADMELKEEKINLLSYRKSLPISKKAFLQHVEDLCANDNAKFHEEFAELPKLLQDLATSDADLPWNRSKNRFTNIKPNNNRVKLLSEPGIPGSDYINASFVSQGYLCPNEFIATQGPLPGTVADFWRMIWETRTKTVAMLTQCFEKGRIRCHQYWPEDNKPVTVFGDIVITKLTEDVHPDWTVRALRVERAGVGRTGVFIALDHLIQHVRDHDFVDVYGLVAELRSERMCMVQNLAQYMFLYQSTLDLLTSKGNSQSIWFVNYSALEKMDSLDAMEDVELEWEETTM